MMMNTETILAELDRLFSERKIREAETFLDEQVRLALHTNNTPLLLTLYNEQEGIYRNTGRAGKAVDCGQKALELIEILGLIGSRFHAITLINTATALRMDHDSDRAIPSYSEALSILTAEDPSDPLLIATCYNNMSQAYSEMGNESNALQCLEKAYDLICSIPGKNAETAITAVNIALSHLSFNRINEAEKFLKRAETYYETTTGKADRHRGAWLSAMGEFHVYRGDRRKAAEFYEAALKETLAVYGENDACKRIRQAMEKYGLNGDRS